MVRYRIRIAAMLGMALAGSWSACTLPAQEAAGEVPVVEAPAVLPQYAGEEGYAAPGIDVFHNYYPNTMSGVNSASMYPAPYPTPGIAGHVYYTYQPLMPHEYLYQHTRTYYNTYGGPEMFYQDPGRYGACGGNGYGLNKTTVVWQSGAFYYGPNPLRVLPLQQLRGVTGRLQGLGGCSTCR
ncbi:MAG TPA: hypothetical protein PLI18_03020 [Pirellulaceae bacterium]|nr:hypothetical protein [Pirellulaceae bacterium]